MIKSSINYHLLLINELNFLLQIKNLKIKLYYNNKTTRILNIRKIR